MCLMRTADYVLCAALCYGGRFEPVVKSASLPPPPSRRREGRRVAKREDPSLATPHLVNPASAERLGAEGLRVHRGVFVVAVPAAFMVERVLRFSVS